MTDRTAEFHDIVRASETLTPAAASPFARAETPPSDLSVFFTTSVAQTTRALDRTAASVARFSERSCFPSLISSFHAPAVFTALLHPSRTHHSREDHLAVRGAQRRARGAAACRRDPAEPGRARGASRRARGALRQPPCAHARPDHRRAPRRRPRVPPPAHRHPLRRLPHRPPDAHSRLLPNPSHTHTDTLEAVSLSLTLTAHDAHRHHRT